MPWLRMARLRDGGPSFLSPSGALTLGVAVAISACVPQPRDKSASTALLDGPDVDTPSPGSVSSAAGASPNVSATKMDGDASGSHAAQGASEAERAVRAGTADHGDAVNRAAPSALSVIPEPGRADLDPDNDNVVGPPDAVPDCEARLRASGIEFRAASIPVKSMDKGTWSCGAPQVVEYRGSASGIRYNVPPMLTCTMALGMARFERVLQEEAEALFHSPVKRLQHGGTFNCRRMARFDMVSEHSFANAIDLRTFTLANGRVIDVVRHFGARGEEPAAPESQLLRRAARRAYDEQLFSVVLTPLFDPLHRDHFHLDMARYRVDGSR